MSPRFIPVLLTAAGLAIGVIPATPGAAEPAAQPAAPAPPPLPRTTFIATMDGEFGKFDANKDGALTRVEIEAGQRAAATAQARARAQALFQRLDADRNGTLSAAEFGKLPINAPAVDASGIMGFDTNRDGRVTLIEHRTATLINFDRLDADKDGTVSPTEMRGLQARR